MSHECIGLRNRYLACFAQWGSFGDNQVGLLNHLVYWRPSAVGVVGRDIVANDVDDVGLGLVVFIEGIAATVAVNEEVSSEGVLHAGVTAVERCSELFFILEIGTVAPERFGFLVEKRTRDVEKRRN